MIDINKPMLTDDDLKDRQCFHCGKPMNYITVTIKQRFMKTDDGWILMSDRYNKPIQYSTHVCSKCERETYYR